MYNITVISGAVIVSFFHSKKVLSKIRRITPGRPPAALIDNVYALTGILPPYNDIMISAATKAAQPVRRLINICAGDIFFSINIPVMIAHKISDVKKIIFILRNLFFVKLYENRSFI